VSEFQDESTLLTSVAKRSVLAASAFKRDGLMALPSWVRQAACSHEWREVGYSGPDWLVYECIKCDKGKVLRS